MTFTAADLEPGKILPLELEKDMLIQLMRSRAWGGSNPLHWDAEFAQERGFPAPVATGQMSSAYLAQLCVECFGTAMFSDSTLAVKFISPIYAGDHLTIGGRVSDLKSQGDRTRVEVDLWCNRQDGTTATVASGQCWIPSN